MRVFLALASLLALSAAGCGSSSSGCQAVSDALSGVSTKAAPCNTDGGSSMSSGGSFNTATCNMSCSSSSDQSALNTIAGCLNQLPTCSPDKSSDFFLGLVGCLGGADVSMGCKSTLNSSSGGDQ